MTAILSITTRDELARQALAEALDWFREDAERFEWTAEMVRDEVLATFDLYEFMPSEDAIYRPLAVAAALALLSRGPDLTEDELAAQAESESEYRRSVCMAAFGTTY